MSPEEDRTRDTVDSEPKHYQLSYSGPSYSFNNYIIYDKFWHWWGILPKVNYHFLCFNYVQVKIVFFAPCRELVNLAEVN